MIFVAVFPLKRLSPIPLPVFEALGRVALAIARSRASATRATRERTLRRRRRGFAERLDARQGAVMSDTLEGRIAAMLSAADAGSDAVAALIQEAETAAQQADADAAKARADALDPAVVIDVAQMSAKVTAAELTRDRIRAVLPKLRERLDDAHRREYAAAWLEDYERVEAEVAALAADLTKAYTECVARLIDTLGRIPALDAQVARVNNRAPPGVKDRLQLVEQTARCVDSFGPNGLLSLRTELKLPKFTFTDGDRYQFSWPLPQPSLAAQMASMPVPRGIAGPDWHLMIDERDRQRREESERLSAFYEKREREGEKRRETELREARGAHRREYGY